MRQARTKITDSGHPVTDPAMPLFYKTPAILALGGVGEMRLAELDDYGFTSETAAVPMTAAEFAAAAVYYPIVFSQSDDMPLAVVGGQDGLNLFAALWTSELRPKTGKVSRRHYVPAYVRRYPFIAAEGHGGDTPVLAIDVACDRVSLAQGEALFDAQGAASAVTQKALRLCHDYHADHLRTRAFVAALQAEGMLVPHHVARQQGQQSFRWLEGFQIVDEAAFHALSPDTLAIWHRNQWLALVLLHLISQRNWTSLVERYDAGRQGHDSTTCLRD